MQRDLKLQFFILVCLLSACSRQNLEGGKLGNADAQVDSQDGVVYPEDGDAQADGPTSQICTQDGIAYPEGATVPGQPGCYDCQCLQGRIVCPTVLCVIPSKPTPCAITANLKPSKPDAGILYREADLPATHEFSLLIDWTNKTATTGSGGTASQVRISMDESDGSWSTQGNLTLAMDLAPTWSAADVYAHRPSISYQKIVIRPIKDGCMGRATGTYDVKHADVVYDIPFEAELIGRVDHSGPSFRFFPSDRAEFHPFDLRGVAVDELLPVGTSARLVAADGTVIPLTAVPAGSAVGVSGFLLDQHALAFGTSYQLQVMPSASDLAGNLRTPLPSLITQAGPGFFAQDGFEGPVDALLGGQVKVIDAAVQPVPSGTHAIRFGMQVNWEPEPREWSCDDRFTARLRVPPGAKSVKLNVVEVREVRIDLPGGPNPFSGWLRLAVPHGAVTGERYWRPSADELKSIELALPEGVDGEVIFDLYRPCTDPPSNSAGLILDDLRVE